MYRPRDITDSIATVGIIILLIATIAYVVISITGFQIADIESAVDDVDASTLDPLFQSPLGLGFDFNSLDPASKIILGSLFAMMVFLVIILFWVYWYRYRGRNK
ncbi:hypothetical protein [Methanocella arvoryzae]|uniref:hypothetical protein n=1 Tax=Methanocella arvoryzae TaxID=1175445 RepID=UPI00032592C6|nr:hypothetical protein [Methanocella arvoryzae]